MKYMTFNSSCSYAGLANMLEMYGVDTEDHKIALGMDLPYLFTKDDGRYLSGPMLQSAEWFNLFLLPLGFEMTETPVLRNAVPDYLKRQHCAMLGMRISEHDKHAVIYLRKEGEYFHFLNNKHLDNGCEEEFSFSEEALLQRLDAIVVIATLSRCKASTADIRMHLHTSLETLCDMEQVLDDYLSAEHTPQEIRAQLNILFRPVFLDGISMMKLIGRNDIAQDMLCLQNSLMTYVKSQKTAIPYDYISKELLCRVINDLKSLVQSRI